MNTPVDQLEIDCDALMDRIADVNASPAEAEELANKFLGLTHRISRRIRNISNDLIPLELEQTLSYSKAFESIDAKANVSKAKAAASADKNHLVSIGKYKKKENEKKYWERTFDVFTNAHIFYKLLCRE